MEPIEISSDSSYESSEQDSGDSTEQDSGYSTEEDSDDSDGTHYYSDRSYDYDSEDGTPLSLRNGHQNALWETFLTKHIIYASGVMHFPLRVGKLIPETLGDILVNEKDTNMYYVMSIGIATRSPDEKYLHGINWRNFIDGNNLQVGDVLEWEIQSHPLQIIVEIKRNPWVLKKKGSNGGGGSGKKEGKKSANSCVNKKVNGYGKKPEYGAVRKRAAF